MTASAPSAMHVSSWPVPAAPSSAATSSIGRSPGAGPRTKPHMWWPTVPASVLNSQPRTQTSSGRSASVSVLKKLMFRSYTSSSMW